MYDSVTLSMLLFAAGAFGAWNLYRGIVTQRTWVQAIHQIERRKSPWSYWIAISFWALFTAVLMGAFICEVAGFSIVSHK